MKHAYSLILPILLVLGGCLPSPFSTAPSSGKDDSAASGTSEQTPVEHFIAINEAGTLGAVDDEAFGGRVDITVEAVFTSAGGRTCKRAVVSRPPHEAEIVILCREDGGKWAMMPRVWGRGLQ